MKILRKVSAAVGIAVLAIFALFMVSPAAVYAQEDGGAGPVVADGVGKFVITSPVWTIITGLLLPIVVGFVTKIDASARVKAVIGILVAAAGATVLRATTVDGSAVFDKALVLDIALVYIPQIASYLGVWRQFDLNQKTAPTVGVG